MKKSIWLITISTWIIAITLVLYTQDAFKPDPIENPVKTITNVISYKDGLTDNSRYYFVKSECAANALNIGTLFGAVFAINGVASVSPTNYRLIIMKAECYKWSEIHDEIISIIEKHIVLCENKMEPIEKEERI